MTWENEQKIDFSLIFYALISVLSRPPHPLKVNIDFSLTFFPLSQSTVLSQ